MEMDSAPREPTKRLTGALLPLNPSSELRMDMATRVKTTPAPRKTKTAIRFEADLPCFDFCSGDGSNMSGLSALISFPAFLPVPCFH